MGSESAFALICSAFILLLACYLTVVCLPHTVEKIERDVLEKLREERLRDHQISDELRNELDRLAQEMEKQVRPVIQDLTQKLKPMVLEMYKRLEKMSPEELERLAAQ